MTPSEIADWLDRMSDEFTDLSPAAATIRDLEAKLKIATEALEGVEELSEEILIETHAAMALDRIKEV